MARQFPPSLLERARGIIKEIRLNVGDLGGGVALGGGGKEEKADELRTWLETLGGVLLIDEAHNMPPEVGHVLYNAIQSVGMNHPLMVVIAGTPDLKQVLGRSKATFIERSPVERIGRLRRVGARKAIFEPFGRHIGFSDEAVADVLDDAQDYPCFISSGVRPSGKSCPGHEPAARVWRWPVRLARRLTYKDWNSAAAGWKSWSAVGC